jgi:uncharacterized membrane protein
MDTGKSGLGLDGNVAAALGYPIGIFAIIALIIEKENRFVKFHALQSLLLHVAFTAVGIVLVVVIAIVLVVIGMAAAAAGGGAAGGTFSGIFVMISFLIGMAVMLAYVIALIISAVNAYSGQKFMLPVVGGLAEKWTK